MHIYKFRARSVGLEKAYLCGHFVLSYSEGTKYCDKVLKFKYRLVADCTNTGY